MTSWHTQFNPDPSADPSITAVKSRTSSIAFPYCNMRGGLCETLLSALPLAIIVIQFIRDGYDVVQDGIITVANDKALQTFAPGAEQLTGSLFLQTCSSALPHGAWHRCLWVASSRKTETLVAKADDTNKQSKTLTIASYGDGLLLALSAKLPELSDIKPNALAGL